MLEARHEDNAIRWDAKNQKWTECDHRPGLCDYIERLDRPSGPRKTGLSFGGSVQAEAVEDDSWDVNVHRIDQMPRGWEAWPRYMGIDFWFTTPFVCQWWALSPDGDLYLSREIYKTRTLV